MKKDIWFKAKTYGWGWYPCTWQGWSITLLFISLAVLISLIIKTNPVLYLILLWTLILVLFLICWKKGEKPRWRWG